jgi:hypothetical protein
MGFLVLIGCAKKAYVHPEYSEERWQKDHKECTLKADKVHRRWDKQGSHGRAVLKRDKAYDQCMRARGWRLEEK